MKRHWTWRDPESQRYRLLARLDRTEPKSGAALLIYRALANEGARS